MDYSLNGKRVRCIEMNDPFPIKPNEEGTIQFVDDIKNIHVKWDFGSSLSLVPDADKYEILD